MIFTVNGFDYPVSGVIEHDMFGKCKCSKEGTIWKSKRGLKAFQAPVPRATCKR